MKILSPSSLTDEGILIVFKQLHSKNDSVPIYVTESGIKTLVNEEHPLNYFSFIDVTEDGIVMLFNELQFSKALFPM